VEFALFEPPEHVVPPQSKVVVPPVVSVPANSSPISRWKVQFPVPVQVTVNVALVVLGDIAPKAAPDEAPLNPILPSCANVHPGAVRETAVAAVLLTQFTPMTTASLAAFAEAVNVNVDAEEDPACCANTFVWVICVPVAAGLMVTAMALKVVVEVKLTVSKVPAASPVNLYSA
jgi:hypothetical protein